MKPPFFNRTLVSIEGTAPWQTEPPTTPGDWEIACVETDYEPSRVRVFERHGELWVDDPDVGTNPMDHYHYNLIDLHWRPAAVP